MKKVLAASLLATMMGSSVVMANSFENESAWGFEGRHQDNYAREVIRLTIDGKLGPDYNSNNVSITRISGNDDIFFGDQVGDDKNAFGNSSTSIGNLSDTDVFADDGSTVTVGTELTADGSTQDSAAIQVGNDINN